MTDIETDAEVDHILVDLRLDHYAQDALLWLAEQPEGIAIGAPWEVASTLRHSRCLRRCLDYSSELVKTQRRGIYRLTSLGRRVAARLESDPPSMLPQTGGVYFIQGATTKLIKIGIAEASVRMRMAALQCGSPDVLELIGHYPADYAHEAAWHRRFASARLHGEWFRPTPELLEYIAQAVLEKAA